MTRAEIALENQSIYRLPARFNREDDAAFVTRIEKAVTEILILELTRGQNEICGRLKVAKR